MSSKLRLYSPPGAVIVPAEAMDHVSALMKYSRALRPKDNDKIIKAFQDKSYDMAVEYAWRRALRRLLDKVVSFGMTFIGEMLDRPLTDQDDPTVSLNDAEVIRLAQELGVVDATAGLRLRQHYELLKHFESSEAEGEMDKIDALAALKVLIQSVLGVEEQEGAVDFIAFRDSLTKKAFESNDLEKLLQSPYFFKRTTIRTLLNLLVRSRGAALENVSRNVVSIIPTIWDDVFDADRWTVGRAYAEAITDGSKASSKPLKQVLVLSKGFDFVPENLRSDTFIKAAGKLIQAHEEFDNFYKEPGPAKELSSLGSRVPKRALGQVASACLASYLGNRFGHCYDAEDHVWSILKGFSQSDWEDYLDQYLPADSVIVPKLMDESRPIERWVKLTSHLNHLNEAEPKNKLSAALLEATVGKRKAAISKLANSLYSGIYGKVRAR